jgi:hypothetical protein
LGHFWGLKGAAGKCPKKIGTKGPTSLRFFCLRKFYDLASLFLAKKRNEGTPKFLQKKVKKSPIEVSTIGLWIGYLCIC